VGGTTHTHSYSYTGKSNDFVFVQQVPESGGRGGIQGHFTTLWCYADGRKGSRLHCGEVLVHSAGSTCTSTPPTTPSQTTGLGGSGHGPCSGVRPNTSQGGKSLHVRKGKNIPPSPSVGRGKGFDHIPVCGQRPGWG
jgi:hypothetical protein